MHLLFIQCRDLCIDNKLPNYYLVYITITVTFIFWLSWMAHFDLSRYILFESFSFFFTKIILLEHYKMRQYIISPLFFGTYPLTLSYFMLVQVNYSRMPKMALSVILFG